MPIINPTPEELKSPELPVGELVEAEFHDAEYRDVPWASDDNPTKGVRFVFRITDGNYPDARGEFVDQWVVLPRDRRRYARWCRALGVDPESAWDSEAVRGTPVLIEITAREDANGVTRYGIRQVVQR